MRLPSRRPARLLGPLCAVLGAAVLVLAAGIGAGPSREVDSIRLGHSVPDRVAQAPAQWCGTDRVATDRPDVVGGNQVHVLYAIPSDGADQFGAYASRIVTDLGAVDAWWRRQDPARTPRFDLAAFAGCTTAAGATDLSFVRLPQPASAFLTPEAALPALVGDLAAAGLNVRTKRYLIYYDGPTTDTGICGTAFRDPTGNGGPDFIAAVWIRSDCDDIGSGNYLAAATAHELLHSLGALPAGAPHPCPRDAGHPCDSAQDLMYPNLSDNFANLILDVNRDDYYGHSGTWLDIQDSRWLMRADVPPSALTVTVRGQRPEDKVTSDPAGIACPSACSILLDTASQVRLVAAPAAGSRFLGWTGACAGAEPSCTVAMDAAKTVEASFGPSTFALVLSVTGKGRAAAPALALSCTRRCSTPADADTLVRVRAFPTKGWRFGRWTGSCRGTGTCTLKMSQNRAVAVVFQRIPPKRKPTG